MTRRGQRVSPATIFFALLSIALAIALYLKTRPAPPGPPSPAPPPARTSRPTPSRPRPTAPKPPAPRSPRAGIGGGATGLAAIVIDDLGNELAPAERIAGWKAPVAGAVLPGVAFSAASARALARGGKEVLLHLPMEPAGYPKVRPGPGVILRSQTDAEIVHTLETDLATVPGAVGVNNHMGSVATADPRVMRVVARVLSERGLYFLDSRTTEATVAGRTAEEASVPSRLATRVSGRRRNGRGRLEAARRARAAGPRGGERRCDRTPVSRDDGRARARDAAIGRRKE